MRKITFLFLLLTVLWSSQAQDFNDSCTSAFEDISSTGTALGLSDDGEAAITLPFDFTLTGQTSRDLLIGNNGGVLFGISDGDLSYSNRSLDDDNVLVGFYPFWDDIDDNAGDVYWEVKGSAPNRYVVIEWYQRPHYNNIDNATFELILYEGTNEVEFRYQDIVFNDSSLDYGASATIGIKASGGVYQYSYNTAIDSSVTCIHWTPPAQYNPYIELSIDPDCANSQFFVTAHVGDLGGASSLTLSDDQGSPSQQVADTVDVTFGPYADGTQVTITAVNNDDSTYTTSQTVQYYCPPPNDECADAIALTVYPADSSAGHEIDATTSHATQSDMGHTSCDSYGTNLDVFYSFVAPNSGRLKIITGGDRGSTVEAAVYDGCNGNELECFGRSTEKIMTDLTPGQTYILQVWHDAGSEGDFTIVLEEMVYTDPEFELTPVGHCDTSNPTFDLQVHITDMGGADSVTITDDQGSSSQQVTDTTTVTFGPYDEGTNVTITVTNDEDTTYTTSHSYQYYCPPENDNCADAIELTIEQNCDNPTVGNNQGATDSGVGDPGCANYQGGDIWYYTTTTQDLDTLIFETKAISGSNFTDSGMAVYTGDCSSLSEVNCDDDGGESVRSKIIVTNVAANTTYYIRIWEYGNNDSGEIGICAYSPSLAVANQLSADQFRIFPNPTNGLVHWEAKGSVERVQLSDITGQILFNIQNPTGSSINIAGLPNGIYLLHVWMDGRQGIYRVVKK
ncbi:MAG: T9SS type A sorting domain-containing protein [Chlorobi bacterium]|nr:T9SS type A sorting domain-containing protein [Chlorobiota bacterium]